MKHRATAGQAFNETAVIFARILPTLLGVLGLVSLVTTFIPLHMVAKALAAEGEVGPILGALVGSVAAGHPLTSYILAGELQAVGLDLATIIAFLVSWVTVGVVQLPAEVAALGARFALYRNAICFISAISIGYLMPLTLRILS